MSETSPTTTPTRAPTRTVDPEIDPDKYRRADPERLCPEQKDRTIKRIAPHLP
jgi:hypothetical protein